MKTRQGMRWLGACAVALAWGASAQQLPARQVQDRWVDGEGHALYVYDADTVPGQSACGGPCAHVWPPFTAAAGATMPQGFGVIVRTDGGRQWTLQGHPLYRYAGDATAQDTRGDGVNGAWHLAH